jgi:lipopolysaccharide/colanic/teichoic acid biosynthesis glycosyltransferase
MTTAAGEGSGSRQGTQAESGLSPGAGVAAEKTGRTGQLPAPPVRLILASEYESDKARRKRLAALAAWMENPRELHPVHSSFQVLVKRILDVVISSFALLLCLPLFVVIALAIVVTSPGPALFRQERSGLHGRPFTFLKFRTMRDLRPVTAMDTTAPFFKIEADPRLTPIGRLLRKWSLDELPQLWNVLKGEMSLVGPRPLPTEQVAANPELLGPRFQVRPGITGLWQVSGRYNLSVQEALRLDLSYVESWSVTDDLWILAKTIPAVFTTRGAY